MSKIKIQKLNSNQSAMVTIEQNEAASIYGGDLISPDNTGTVFSPGYGYSSPSDSSGTIFVPGYGYSSPVNGYYSV
ncbi:MAG: hypothetical protein ACRC80_17195 [Waterburya sp.]